MHTVIRYVLHIPGPRVRFFRLAQVERCPGPRRSPVQFTLPSHPATTAAGVAFYHISIFLFPHSDGPRLSRPGAVSPHLLGIPLHPLFHRFQTLELVKEGQRNLFVRVSEHLGELLLTTFLTYPGQKGIGPVTVDIMNSLDFVLNIVDQLQGRFFVARLNGIPQPVVSTDAQFLNRLIHTQ